MPSERRVYIIEIRPPWIDAAVGRAVPEGVRCLYVGETGKDVEQRVAEHLAGPLRVAQCFKNARKAKASTLGQDWQDTALTRGTDVWLRSKMLEKLPATTGNDAAQELEAQVVDSLRRRGFLVFPRGVGTEPFDGDYRIWPR